MVASVRWLVGYATPQRTVLAACCLLTQVSIGAEPAHRVRVRLVGDESVAARVSVTDSRGEPHAPDGAILRKDSQGRAYFYAAGDFELGIPEGPSQWSFSRGLETVPRRISVDCRSDLELEVRLDPWTRLATRGWYSGDSHVHLHTGGPLNVTVNDALVAARAEDLNYVNLCVSNNEGDDIRDADLITGQAHSLSTSQHLLVFGEEMRSSIYGHMQFFGIRKLVEPQYTGFNNTPQHHDYPANYVMAAEAIRQGGIVTYGHPMFSGQPDPFSGDPAADNAAARELPIDAILGLAHAIDLMSYNSDEVSSTELWYRLLNCGIRLSACVGTDALLDRETDPMGGERVYVKVDGGLTMRGWLDGLKSGRSFVTNGPLASLKVNGLDLGDTCRLAGPETVHVTAQVESLVPFEVVEVMVNGQVAHTGVPAPGSTSGDVRLMSFDVELPIRQSSWVALRVRAAGHESHQGMGGPAWAHTSPVYVQVQEQPITSREDAVYFVDWIEKLLRVVATRDRYASASDRQQVEQRFREAQDRFRLLAP